MDHGRGHGAGCRIHVARLEAIIFGEMDPGVALQKAGSRSIRVGMNNKALPQRKKCGACLLMLATLAVGVYPKLLLDRIMPAVEAMRFLNEIGRFTMSYFELLKLVSPETIVVITALAVLTFGLRPGAGNRV